MAKKDNKPEVAEAPSQEAKGAPKSEAKKSPKGSNVKGVSREGVAVYHAGKHPRQMRVARENK